MEDDDRNWAHVLEVLTTNFPLGFWQGLQDRARALYLDRFSEVSASPQLNNSQRLSALWQDRHYRMEWLLADEAEQHGVPASTTLIPRNGCSYTLVAHGPVRLVQNYVRRVGAMPRPARFRSQLASINTFERDLRLDLIEDERPFRAPSEFIGVILSSPFGAKFREDHQALGAIGLHVPYSDLSGWAVSLPLAEIVASYEVPDARPDIVKPRLKPGRKTGTEE